MPDKDLIPSEGKPKPKQRLLVNPAELGLTGRIKKALLEQDMGITQRIKKAVEKTQDVNSFFYMKRNHFIMVGALLFLVIVFGYFAFRSRDLKLRLMFPLGDPLEQSLKVYFYEFGKDLELPDYPRQIVFKRYDIYGKDISDHDFEITDKDGKKVKDPRSLYPGVYNLLIKKEGYKEQRIPLPISKIQVDVPVELEPLIEPKRELKLYLNDPLIGGDIEPDDVRLVKDNKSIKNLQIKPGKYALVLEKAGYHSKEIELVIPENGIVRDKVTLDYKERAVKLLVDDGLNKKGYEPEVKTEEIKLFREGQAVQFKGNLHPGFYDLEIQRDGYYPYKTRVKITAGGDLLTLPLPLQPKEREIVVRPNYDVAPADVKPDKAYLKDLYGSDKETIPITEGLRVKPGSYWVKVEKANYHPYSRNIEITPSSNAFEVRAQLISVSKLILLQIRSDFDIEPSINPDELLFDMRIGKAGYVPIDWGKIKRPLPPEKKEIEVPVFLETIPRKVISEVTCDITPGPVAADVMSLTRIIEGKPADQAIDISKSGVEVKPARYMLLIRKFGFDEVREEQLIYPGTTPYLINKELKAVNRSLMVKLDTDYEPNQEVKADEMKLNQKAIESGTPIKPGTYTLFIRKEGFHAIEKILKVDVGNEPVVVQEQLKAKHRRLLYDIKGDNLAKISPDVVTFDGTSVIENAEIPVKKAYEVEIKKKGYGVLKKSVAILPSEQPYQLSEILSPLRRKVQLLLDATFPKGKDLLPADSAMLGKENLAQETEVKPDTYNLSISKAGYRSINRPVEVPVGEGPFILRETMSPKEREVRSEIDYDVASEQANLPQIIKIQNEEGVDREVKPGDKIDPNKYKVEVSVDGYEKVVEEAVILPSESSYTFKYTLKAKPRMVILNITADYPPGKQLTPDSVLMNGEPFSEGMVQMFKSMKPGRYSMAISKSGYNPVKKEVVIPAGSSDYVIKEQLFTMPRLVTYRLYDAEKKDKELVPDRITLASTPVTQSNSFKPGNYRLFIQTQGYPDVLEDIQIDPGVEPYKIERGLVASTRIVKYELTGDYSSDILTPKEINLNGINVASEGSSFAPGSYQMAVYIPGYERLVKRIDFGASRDPFIIREKLTSKKRKVVFKITANFPEGVSIKPRKVIFHDKEIIDGEEVKPRLGGYQVTIENEGYMPVNMNALIEPSEDVFDLVQKLQARPRRLKFEIDGSYQPGKALELDTITVNAKSYQTSDAFDPGNYKIFLAKAGYKSEEFDQPIVPGETPVVIKKTMDVLPREFKVIVKSGFSLEIMEPEECILGARPVAEGPYKPGSYELVIAHPGYFGSRDKIEVVPGTGVQEITQTLMPKKRKVIPDITYDTTPVADSPLEVIRMRKEGRSEAYRIEKGDEMETGEYLVTIEKEGFETIADKRITIRPDERPYELKETLEASMVEILIEILYDIEPPANLQPYTVTFIDKKSGIGRNITSGKKIKPGDYTLQVGRPGYLFKEVKKDISIPALPKPFFIKEKLFAKPRQLSFEMMSVENNLVKAIEVLVDNKEAKAGDTFKPGNEYMLKAKFKEYKTAQKKIVILPGEAPFVVDLNLVKLEKFDFGISKRYYEASQGMLIDSIRYSLEIFCDNDPVEPHHINQSDETAGMIQGYFYAMKTIRNMKIVCGFYYDESLASPGKPNQFRDLKKIDTGRLLDHLRETAKANPGTALKRMARLLEDKQDKYKIDALPKEDKDRLVDLLRNLDLTDASQQELRVQSIKKLQSQQ